MRLRGAWERKGSGCCLHCEIKCKKPHFQYTLYHECGEELFRKQVCWARGNGTGERVADVCRAGIMRAWSMGKEKKGEWERKRRGCGKGKEGGVGKEKKGALPGRLCSWPPTAPPSRAPRPSAPLGAATLHPRSLLVTLSVLQVSLHALSH
eukprot:26022-Rhodomonas_salina.1